MIGATLYVGHVLDVVARLEAESVQCIVTSPPYYGLRDYGLEPQVWGGDPAHRHRWTVAIQPAANGLVNNVMQGVTRSGHSATRTPKTSAFCRCGAWRGSLGLEPTPELYVEHLVGVFRDLRRVLRKDGTLWLNMGDSYCTTPRGNRPGDWSTSSLTNPQRQDRMPRGRSDFGKPSKQRSNTGSNFAGPHRLSRFVGLKGKDLLMMPARVALALQADGWWLRADVIWVKPNPMPESVTDRPTNAHEHVFLLAKSERYYYDGAAIEEPLASRPADLRKMVDQLPRYGGKQLESEDPLLKASALTHVGRVRGVGNAEAAAALLEAPVDPAQIVLDGTEDGGRQLRSRSSGNVERDIPSDEDGRGIPNDHLGRGIPWADNGGGRNARSVWTISTVPYPGAHFATFPPELARRCILAGTRTAGKRCDCDQVILTPTGNGESVDPTLQTGRAGMNRPRRHGEGSRSITRREQRWHARELSESPHREAMRLICGAAFDHYVRTDASGARPLPETVRQAFLARGWITEPPPCEHPVALPDVVLDPFGGSGTVAAVAVGNGRRAVYIDLKPEFREMARDRIGPMLCADG